MGLENIEKILERAFSAKYSASLENKENRIKIVEDLHQVIRLVQEEETKFGITYVFWAKDKNDQIINIKNSAGQMPAKLAEELIPKALFQLEVARQNLVENLIHTGDLT